MVPKIKLDGGGGGQKNLAIHRGDVDFFWNIPMQATLSTLR